MANRVEVTGELARTRQSLNEEAAQVDLLIGSVSNYRAAIENLPKPGEPGCERGVLAVLLARDELSNTIAKDFPKPTDLVFDVAALDQKVKKNARILATCTGSATLQNWRDLFQPGENAWWWYLDRRVSEFEQAHTIIWMLLTGFAVTLTISIAADISGRFLVGVPDRLSIFSTASQVFLALVAGSSFTQAGRDWIVRLLTGLHIKPGLQPVFGFLLALVVLSVTVGFRYSLPSIARYYNREGAQSFKDNKVRSALEEFQRAISLDPDNSEAQYNLAYAQEGVFDYDKAIVGYQKAIELKPDFDEAYNNLAHLYLLYRSDYKRALDILSRVFSKPINNMDLKYAAYKNRAWAFIGQEQFELSETDLRLALQIHDGAELHCMRGQVLFGKGKNDEAVGEWSKCLEMSKNDSNGVEPYWQALAMTGIRKG